MVGTIAVALLVYLAIAGAHLGLLGGSIDYAFAPASGRKPRHMVYYAVGAFSLAFLLFMPIIQGLLNP